MRSSLALIALGLLAGCTSGSGAVHRVPTAKTLVIVLPGAPGVDHGDPQAFAEAARAAIPDSRVLALPARPVADYGHGLGNAEVRALAEAIDAEHRRHPAARTVLVGDSSGAALAANLASARPALVDGLVLVGCPCSLPEWRAWMARQSKLPGWKAPVESLDPLQTAGGLSSTLRAAVLVGADDQVTPVRFSRAYAEALALRGIATDYRIVPGKGHDLLNDPEVLAATQRLAATLPRKPI